MSTAALTLLLKSLDLLVLGLEVAPNIRTAFADVTASVQLMINEGRDPTPVEWAKLDELRNTIHFQIQVGHKG